MSKLQIKHITRVAMPVMLLACMVAKAQVSDNFADGNFTTNPAWTGNTTEWQVNTDAQLQSNSTTANSNFYLSAANSLATAAQWDFYVKLTFNPSGANYVDVYLTASAPNLTLTNTSGYFVRLGDTPDEISLYRKDANGSSTKIIDGLNGLLNRSSNELRIRVTRNAANLWTLSRDDGATGAFFTEGTVTDATYTTSAAFGIWVRQSTSSFFQRHFFDDVEVKPFVPDVTPPALASVNAVSNRVVEVLFSESVQTTAATTTANYVVSNGVGSPSAVQQDAVNPLLFRLSFAANFPNGANLTLTVNVIADLAGNVLNNASAAFSFYTPQRYDVVIHEIMADPSPAVGLPVANWIELRNTSAFAINLQGYRLVRAGSISGPLPNVVLRPDSFLIVCTGSAVPALSPFGHTVAVVSFPTLPVGGDLIWLQDNNGSLMHAVAYTPNWYQNPVNEMIDARNACSGSSNWRASNNPAGGTPGRPNSIAASNTDRNAPALLQAFAPNNTTLLLTFSEPLDSAASAAAAYAVSNGLGNASAASLLPPLFTQVQLTLANAMQPGVVYTITATGVRDCSGNALSTAANTAKAGLAAVADSLDIVVNEILFNPKPLGVDYVEFYNRSNKVLDAASLFFTNRSSTTGNPGALIPLSTVNRLIFPGEYYVVTENPELVKQQFTVPNEAWLATSDMPSLPDDKGTILLLNQNGRTVEEVSYDQRWHFALVDNNEGIALERIDYNRPGQQADNWTSAAASAGFGTPTGPNSQFRTNLNVPSGSITLNPPLFSPDNDGFEDFTLIEWQLNQPGYVGNLIIMDAAGRQVRILQRNTTLAARGSFRWDGLNDQQQRLPVGNYVVWFEVFNLQGQKQVFKKGVTLARRF
ncbi:MAG: lamin tail domain-containing protein [Chitinophagaceae bacterium]|nr:lamin tail domain-containing protein [Chitinophagaceae bacterium]